jgi:hypothetical protein
MRISVYFNAKTDTHYSASTGLTLEEFNLLFQSFGKHYHAPSNEFPEGFGNEFILSDAREALFFILYHLKTDLSYEVLGLNFGMSKGTAHKNVVKLKPYLKCILQFNQVLPKRLFEKKADFDDYFKGIDDLYIDATEIPIQRPQNKEFQYDSFSVKQHQNGVKNTIISDHSKYIYFLGKTTPAGRTHDYQLLKNDFTPTTNFFKEKSVKVDTAYLGMLTQYQTKNIEIPHRMPRKSKANPIPTLTKEQKEHNRKVSSKRVMVENAIGGMKRYNILSHPSRCKNIEIIDNTTELCAGLWNFKLKCKKRTKK